MTYEGEYVRSTCERINHEPIVFRGLSSSELRIAIIATLLFWIPLSLAVGFVSGYPTVGFGVIGIGSLLTIMFLGSVFQQVKRGRPDGYYQQMTTLMLVHLRLKSNPFVKYSGGWSIGRSVHK